MAGASALNLSLLSRGVGEVSKNGHEKIDVVFEPQDYFNFAGGSRTLFLPPITPQYSFDGPKNSPAIRYKSEVPIPKTFTTRKGALLLYSEDMAQKRWQTQTVRRHRRPIHFLDDASSTSSQSDDENDLRTVDDLAKSILSYGSHDQTSSSDANGVYLKFVHGHRRKDYFERQIRPGFSAKRYLSSWTKSWDDSVLEKVISKGYLTEKSLFYYNPLMPHLQRRLNDDMSHYPSPYRLMRSMLMSPGSLSGYTFYRVRPESSETILTQEIEMFAPPPGSRGAPIKVISTRDGVQREVTYASLDKKAQEEVLTDLLVKSAVHYAIKKQQEYFEDSLARVMDSGREIPSKKEEVQPVPRFDMKDAVETLLDVQNGSQLLDTDFPDNRSDASGSFKGKTVRRKRKSGSTGKDKGSLSVSPTSDDKEYVGNVPVVSFRASGSPENVSNVPALPRIPGVLPLPPIGEASREGTTTQGFVVTLPSIGKDGPLVNVEPPTPQHTILSAGRAREPGLAPTETPEEYEGWATDEETRADHERRKRRKKVKNQNLGEGPVVSGGAWLQSSSESLAAPSVQSLPERKPVKQPWKGSTQSIRSKGSKGGTHSARSNHSSTAGSGMEESSVRGSVIIGPGGEMMNVGGAIVPQPRQDAVTHIDHVHHANKDKEMASEVESETDEPEEWKQPPKPRHAEKFANRREIDYTSGDIDATLSMRSWSYQAYDSDSELKQSQFRRSRSLPGLLDSELHKDFTILSAATEKTEEGFDAEKVKNDSILEKVSIPIVPPPSEDDQLTVGQSPLAGDRVTGEELKGEKDKITEESENMTVEKGKSESTELEKVLSEVRSQDEEVKGQESRPTSLQKQQSRTSVIQRGDSMASLRAGSSMSGSKKLTEDSIPLETEKVPTPVDSVQPTPVDQTEPGQVDSTQPTPAESAQQSPVEPVEPSPVEQAQPSPEEPAPPEELDEVTKSPEVVDGSISQQDTKEESPVPDKEDEGGSPVLPQDIPSSPQPASQSHQDLIPTESVVVPTGRESVKSQLSEEEIVSTLTEHAQKIASSILSQEDSGANLEADVRKAAELWMELHPPRSISRSQSMQELANRSVIDEVIKSQKMKSAGPTAGEYRELIRESLKTAIEVSGEELPDDTEVSPELLEALKSKSVSPEDLEVTQDEETGKSIIRTKSEMKIAMGGVKEGHIFVAGAKKNSLTNPDGTPVLFNFNTNSDGAKTQSIPADRASNVDVGEIEVINYGLMDSDSASKSGSEKAPSEKAPSEKAFSIKSASGKISTMSASSRAPSGKAPSEKVPSEKAPSEKAPSEKGKSEKGKSQPASVIGESIIEEPEVSNVQKADEVEPEVDEFQKAVEEMEKQKEPVASPVKSEERSVKSGKSGKSGKSEDKKSRVSEKSLDKSKTSDKKEEFVVGKVKETKELEKLYGQVEPPPKEPTPPAERKDETPVKTIEEPPEAPPAKQDQAVQATKPDIGNVDYKSELAKLFGKVPEPKGKPKEKKPTPPKKAAKPKGKGKGKGKKKEEPAEAPPAPPKEPTPPPPKEPTPPPPKEPTPPPPESDRTEKKPKKKPYTNQKETNLKKVPSKESVAESKTTEEDDFEFNIVRDSPSPSPPPPQAPSTIASAEDDDYDEKDDEDIDEDDEAARLRMISNREARAAKRAAQAEKRKQEVELRRKEREEQLRREKEQQEKQMLFKQQMEEERRRRDEERRLRKQAEEDERDRLEKEEMEALNRQKMEQEKERRRKEEYQRKLEEIKRKQVEEEARKQEELLRKQQEEEERRKQEEEMLATLAEEERLEYERKKKLEEEERLRKEEEDRLRREEEARLAMEEARRLAEEMARKQAELEARLKFNRDLQLESGGMNHSQGMTRAFVFSYYELLQWLGLDIPEFELLKLTNY